MMDLRPELVGEAPPGPHFPEEAEGPAGAFELSATPEADLPDGYIGDPSAATAKLGRALHEAAVEGLVEVLEGLSPAKTRPG